MRITHLGHACVLLESDGGGRLLIDPGTYSTGFEQADATWPPSPSPTSTPTTSTRRGSMPSWTPTRRPSCSSRPRPRPPSRTSASPPSPRDRADRRRPDSPGDRRSPRRQPRPGPADRQRRLRRTGRRPHRFPPRRPYDEAPSGIDVLGLPLNAPWCRMAETLALPARRLAARRRPDPHGSAQRAGTRGLPHARRAVRSGRLRARRPASRSVVRRLSVSPARAGSRAGRGR